MTWNNISQHHTRKWHDIFWISFLPSSAINAVCPKGIWTCVVYPISGIIFWSTLIYPSWQIIRQYTILAIFAVSPTPDSYHGHDRIQTAALKGAAMITGKAASTSIFSCETDPGGWGAASHRSPEHVSGGFSTKFRQKFVQLLTTAAIIWWSSCFFSCLLLPDVCRTWHQRMPKVSSPQIFQTQIKGIHHSRHVQRIGPNGWYMYSTSI